MTVTAVSLGGRDDQPLLVLGPSLGTSATALWEAAASLLSRHFRVVAWDLPGHGSNATAPTEPLTMSDLAADVIAVVDEVAGPAASFHYAGDSVGGAVGLQLLVDAPDRVASAVLLCTGAKIGTEQSWAERAETVRASGTAAVVAGSAERWFGPGFADRQPERASALLHSLRDADAAGYAAVCGALGAFDVRDRLTQIASPVLAVAGAHDVPTPPSALAEIATGVQNGRLEVVATAAHLAPAEEPGRVSELIVEHALGGAGMTVRREVLGSEHVDRATAAATDLTRDFQRFITDYAWGGIWTRPGLDRRSRSMITLTALIARGHHEELAMHVRAARRNGLTVDEIKEVILQSAIYCGVPDANTAFRIAQQTLAEDGEA